MRRFLVAPVFLCGLVVYCMTAYPTITWWDSGSYSLAAATLGVMSPPGSLVLTLLGWPVARLTPAATTAHALNYLAATIAAATIAMVCALALRLHRLADESDERGTTHPGDAALTGAAFGALTFAFTTTLWDYAGRFTPYILSALFTTLILAVMLAWWRDADRPIGTRWILLLGFLFGLDFSVHRTNSLLIPGAIAWVLIRRFSVIKEARSIATGIGGLVAGLLVQLLIVPVAMFARSPLDFNDPSNAERFWAYISLKRLGGGFLLQLLPRKSNLFTTQSADLLRALGENFVGWPRAHSLLGPLPAILAVVGLAAIWRRNGRLGVALLVAVGLQITGTIMYFNIPADYFRSFDRHYLPIFVFIGVLMAVGFIAVCVAVVRSLRLRFASLVAAAAIAAAVPIIQVASEWHEHDASNRFFAHDWATNSLASLPLNAIYFTNGDNDTFPVMYVQSVEGIRRDVSIINQYVAREVEYVERKHRRDPTFPLSSTVTPDSVALHPGERPVTYAATSTDVGTTNRAPMRIDGLYWRVVPDTARAMNIDLARANILDRPNYRGYADPRVIVDEDTRSMAFAYYEAAKALLAEERARGQTAQCQKDLSRLLAALPFARLSVPASYRTSYMTVCDE